MPVFDIVKIKALEKELLAEFQDYEKAPKHYAVGLGASKHHLLSTQKPQFLLQFTGKKLWR